MRKRDQMGLGPTNTQKCVYGISGLGRRERDKEHKMVYKILIASESE